MLSICKCVKQSLLLNSSSFKQRISVIPPENAFSEHEKAAPALPTSPLMVPVEKRHDSSAKASPESKKRGRVRPAKKSDSDSSEDDFLDCGKKKRPVKKERTGSEDVYEVH